MQFFVRNPNESLRDVASIFVTPVNRFHLLSHLADDGIVVELLTPDKALVPINQTNALRESLAKFLDSAKY